MHSGLRLLDCEELQRSPGVPPGGDLKYMQGLHLLALHCSVSYNTMSDHVSIEEASINPAGDVDVVAVFRDATHVPATSGKKAKRKAPTGSEPVYCAGTIPITAFPSWLNIKGENEVGLIQLIECLDLLPFAEEWKFLTLAG